MKETNVFEETAKKEKLITHILPTSLFCEECGITETNPSFGQQYCRYCGTKFKNKPWEMQYELSKEIENWNGCYPDPNLGHGENWEKEELNG